MRWLSFLLVFISSISFAQLSLSDLKRAGIKSEKDLKKLGVSDEEIDALKQEYFQANNTSSSENKSSENKPQPLAPVVEKPLVLESQKQEVKGSFIYGQSLFRSGAVTITKNSDRIKANDGYIIGSGDRVSVTIWGFSEFSDVFTVDDLGYISPKLVGRINLKGRSFKDAKSIIKSKFAKVYDLQNSQIGIELSYSKVISVNVMGEVIAPGTFAVPGINSAFNILSLAKGPNEKGSVRNISVVRNGKIIGNLDIYEFMNNPKKSSNIYLNDGDFIIVPVLGNLVEIKGEVLRPGKFELKTGETLNELVNFAGNFTADANQKNISILRKTATGKVVLSYSFEEAKGVKILNGDEIIVPKNSQVTSNKVTVRGEVNGPGIFEFKDKETLGNLILRANGLTPESYLLKAHIYRLNDELKREIIDVNLSDKEKLSSILLKDMDEVMIFNKKSFMDSSYLHINGLVRNPGKVDFIAGMGLSDLITIVGGAFPQADLGRIEIERIDFKTKLDDTSNYVKITFKSLEANPDFKLQPFDIVNVRALPAFKFQESIEVSGEVKYPGVYSLSGNKVKTSDIIKRAGGLTGLSYGKKAYIKRSEDSLGVILLDLDLVLKDENSPFNYGLRPGDQIVVPRVNDIVSISGAIGAKFINKENKTNVPFKKGKRASFYIKKYAGGYDLKANRRTVYAVTLNGQVKRSKFWGLVKPKVEKGDKVIVSYQKEKEKKEKTNKINWNDQIENVTIKLTGLATLWVLVSQITP